MHLSRWIFIIMIFIFQSTIQASEIAESYLIEFNAMDTAISAVGSQVLISGRISGELDELGSCYAFQKHSKNEIQIKATFPNSTVDVTKNIIFRKEKNGALSFIYSSPALAATNLNQFSIVVFKKKESNKNKSEEQVLAEARKSVYVISGEVKSNFNLISLENLKFKVEATPGVVLKGSQLKITTQVEFLKQKEEKDSRKEKYILRLSKGRQVLAEAQGDRLDFETANLDLGSIVFYSELFEVKDKKTKRIAWLPVRVEVGKDSTPPVIEPRPTVPLPTGYIKNLSAIGLQVADTQGDIDPSSLRAKLKGTQANGSQIEIDVSSSFTILQNVAQSNNRNGSLYAVLAEIVFPKLFAQAVPVAHVYFISGSLFGILDGSYSLEISLADIFGNTSVFNMQFTLDSVVPSLVTATPMTFVTNSSNFPFNLAVSDFTSTTTDILVDNISIGTFSTSIMAPNINTFLPFATEGEHQVKVVTQDQAGNQVVQNFTAQVDFQPPVIAQNPQDVLPDILTVSQKKLVLSITDAMNVSSDIYLNGNKILSTDSKNISADLIFVEGANTIQLLTTDAAGNSSSFSAQVFVDTLPPTLIGLLPLSGSQFMSESVNVSGYANEQLQTVTVNGQVLNLSADGKFFNGTILLNGSGSQNLTWVATDIFGHATTLQTIVITSQKSLWSYEECPAN